jgi:hypothetical protein
MTSLSPRAVFAGFAALVVAAAVTAGLVLIGPPSEARLEQLDARRVEHLQRLSRLIDLHWVKNGRLPASLDELAPELRGADTRDPVTGQPYDYRTMGDKRYELCAVFDRRSNPATREEFWAHGAGRTCYPLDVRAVGR